MICISSEVIAVSFIILISGTQCITISDQVKRFTKNTRGTTDTLRQQFFSPQQWKCVICPSQWCECMSFLLGRGKNIVLQQTLVKHSDVCIGLTKGGVPRYLLLQSTNSHIKTYVCYYVICRDPEISWMRFCTNFLPEAEKLKFCVLQHYNSK